MKETHGQRMIRQRFTEYARMTQRVQCNMAGILYKYKEL